MNRMLGGVAAAIISLGVGVAQAAEIKPAIVYDMGGKFDKSFNEAAAAGVEQFKKSSGLDVLEFEPTNETQIEQALRKMAERGATPIVAVGFNQAKAIEKVSAEFPDLKFAIVDMVVDGPNVQSIVFKEEEGSYLVGMLAALASQSGKVGFIGGMDIPLIRKFACGYAQGVKAVNANAEVLQNMTGNDHTAWNNPGRAGELTKGQIGRGADVIYAAAGASGNGVYQAAKDAGKLAIGVDSNQNYMHPGTMLTSMVKRVDVAVSDVFTSVQNDTWKPGVAVLGLKEEGVGWALDEHNAPLVKDEWKAALDKAKADIVGGKIKVHDYMSDDKCPVS